MVPASGKLWSNKEASLNNSSPSAFPLLLEATTFKTMPLCILRWHPPPDGVVGRALIKTACFFFHPLPAPILCHASGTEVVVDKQFWCHPALWSECLRHAAVEQGEKGTAGFIQLRLKRLLMKSLNYSIILGKNALSVAFQMMNSLSFMVMENIILKVLTQFQVAFSVVLNPFSDIP